jgi:uncharacterized protein (TIGR03437 family)
VFVAVADFNRDGKPDLAVANATSNSVTVLLGNGSGGFTTAPGGPLPVGASPESVTVADFNADGKPDLAIANAMSLTITVLLGTGTGGFTAAPGSPFPVGDEPFLAAVGDFNGDGKPDLAISESDPYGGYSVVVLLGTGTGGFTAAPGSPFAVGAAPGGPIFYAGSLAVGDFNEDGKPDLATVNTSDNNVTVLLNTNTGTTTLLSLTNGTSRDWFPVWRPDGTKILFSSNRNDLTRANDIWEMNPDGSQQIELVQVDITTPSSWGDDGLAASTKEFIGSTGNIAVIEQQDYWEVMKVALSNTTSFPIIRTVWDGPDAFFSDLLLVPGGLGTCSFAYSSATSDAAWINCDSRQEQVRVAPFSQLSGQSSEAIGTVLLTTSSDGAQGGLTFAPSGQQLVASLCITSCSALSLGTDLYVLNAATGQIVQRLTTDGDSRISAIQPRWSPDGQTIAFVSNKSGNNEIWTIHPDGTGAIRVTANGLDNSGPSWSPNSKSLAFATNNNGSYTIWLASMATTTGPSISSGGVLNAASSAVGAPVAPGGIVAVYGSYPLASSATAQGAPWPTSLGGLSVQFDTTQAPLYYASGSQVNLQVPWELSGQTQTTISAAAGGQRGAAQMVNLASYSPGIFSMNGQGTGQGAIVDAISGRLLDSSNPAIAGSTYVSIYCTGLGPVTNQPATGSASPSNPLAATPTNPTVTIGGVQAQVLFSGLAPGFVGEYQVNAQVPLGSATGNAVPVTLSIGGVTSNTVTIAVQVPAGGGTGTLDVQVTGLPAGTPASVSVTSANGYSTVVTANETLQVAPGTYTIVANSVPLGSVTYNAAPQQPITVAAGSSVTVQIPYTTVIPNTTKVLDQAGTSTLAIATDGSTLTMSAQSAVAQSLAPGDVLAAAPTLAAPYGLLRKVVSVSQANGQVTATTTQATLTDAIQQADIQFDANLAPQNITSAIALRPGVEVHVGRRPAIQGTPPGDTRAAVSPMDASDICANAQIVLTKTKDVEIASGLDVTGDIELCGDFAIHASINWLGLHLNSLTATTTLGEHTDLSITGQALGFGATQTIATIQFADIVVPVTPVFALDFAPQVNIVIGASGNVGSSVTAGVSQNASVTAGFSYANGQVSQILQNTPLTFQLDPLTITDGLSVTAFVEADIDLLLYHIAGPYFDPQAYLEFDADVLQNPWWTLSGGLKGPVGLQLNPDLDVLGFDNLPTISFANLFDVSQTFLHAANGFPSLQLLTPNAAPAGSPSVPLTVTGSGFASGSTVTFNGTPLATNFVSSTDLTATVPASDLASAGTFPVTVSNPAPGGGTSAPVNFTVGQSTPSQNPQPSISELSPTSATAGSGPLMPTITGTGFIASSSVTFNGVSHTTSVLSPTLLTITLSASDLATAGSFPIVVTNPAPGGGASNQVNFVVTPSNAPTSYTISTVTGCPPSTSLSGDGGPAASACLYDPRGVALDAAGNLYIADTGNARVRKVSTSGIITTVAGGGSAQPGDGGAATSAYLGNIEGLALDAAGNIYFADWQGNRIRKVSPSGIITTVAGSGNFGYSGDGGPAINASLSAPFAVAVDASGDIYIADYTNNRVRKVSASGIITTAAGNGNAGYSGDGGPATSAQLNGPIGVAVDPSGDVYIADSQNYRIRKLSSNGAIATIAGNGGDGYSGDGGLATSAELAGPCGVALDAAGNLYIGDTGNGRVRVVSPSGIITTVAGSTWYGGYSGDGGPATAAQLDDPWGIAIGTTGLVYVADSGNSAIRLLTPVPATAGSPALLDTVK